MVPPKKAKAQADEIAQLTLNIQKLAQFRAILKDMKAGYEILNGGYNTIKNLSEGNFKIHKSFLDGLMEVSPEVKKYRKVAEIIQYQSRLVKDYQKAWGRFQHSEVFKPSEIQYLSGVYARLLKSSLKNLDELTLVVTASKLRMSDDERIQSIDRIHAD
uniref:TerB family tellurite resistance protein n=1 Tax=Parastrongyloides trichosuri TaxID=131310 RepID=A0A0N5A0C1_PARTI